MDCIKLKTGISKITAVERNQFEEITEMKPPYYPDGVNTTYPFAICPQCDNPVRIIGFYKEISKNPYGEHYKDSVKNLAVYEQSQYDTCPYRDKRKTIPAEEILSELTSNTQKIKEIFRDYFDQVVYYASIQTGIYMSDQEAEERLKIFINGKRWQYPWVTTNNLPWVFVYLSWSKSVYGKLIRKDSLIYQIFLDYKYAKFEKYNDKYLKLTKNNNSFFNPNFCFMHHKREVIGEKLHETMRFCVYDDKKELYSNIIEISDKDFMNLLITNDNHRFRKDKLLAIAKKYL